MTTVPALTVRARVTLSRGLGALTLVASVDHVLAAWRADATSTAPTQRVIVRTARGGVLPVLGALVWGDVVR